MNQKLEDLSRDLILARDTLSKNQNGISYYQARCKEDLEFILKLRREILLEESAENAKQQPIQGVVDTTC